MNCPNVYNCPTPPTDGISAEITQALPYLGVSFKAPPMPLGENWGDFGARATVDSSVSQIVADALADELATNTALAPQDATPSYYPPSIGLTEHRIPEPSCCRCAPDWQPADEQEIIVTENLEPLGTEDGLVFALE